MERDYYRILGVREDVSQEEIKKRYRMLAKNIIRIPIPETGKQNRSSKRRESLMRYSGIQKSAESMIRDAVQKRKQKEMKKKSAGFEQFLVFGREITKRKKIRSRRKKQIPLIQRNCLKSLWG